MFAEKFRSYGIKITGKYICESQNWIWSFLPILPSKTLTQVFIIIHRKKEIIHSSRTAFPEDVFFPAERGEEDYEVEKTTKIKPTRALVTSFDKFHHFCNLYTFSFCFIMQ